LFLNHFDCFFFWNGMDTKMEETEEASPDQDGRCRW